MMFPRAVVFLALVVLAASCGTNLEPCDDGCYDSDGKCQAGTEAEACGADGDQCVACGSGQGCLLGECYVPATGGGAGGGTGGSGGGSSQPSCDNIVGDRKTQVCTVWSCARSSMNEGTWEGNINSCSNAELSANARENTLRLLNAYRFVADLPPVTHDAERNAKAQDCGLMMSFNDLSHYPDTGWPCYTPDGASAAGKANISTGRSVKSIDMYMSDYGGGPGVGNFASLGHRRWNLSGQLGPVGIGGTVEGTFGGGSCLWVGDGTGTETQQYTMWPPPGPVPHDGINIPGLATGGGSGSVNSTGWSIQSGCYSWNAACNQLCSNLTNAIVTVSDFSRAPGLQQLAVDQRVLTEGAGSQCGIAFIPNGWTTEVGHTYHVQVGSLFDYDVEIVDCPAVSIPP